MKKMIAALGVVGVALALWFWSRKPVPVPVPDVPVVAPPIAPALPDKPAPVKPPVKPPAATPRRLEPVLPPPSLPKAVSKPPPAAAPLPAPRTPAPEAPKPLVLPPEPAPMEWQGTDTAVRRDGQVVVRNDRQWVQFWAEHRPHTAAPEVDFTRQMVVGVFAGQRPADEFKITIVGLRESPGRLTVEYREEHPPPGTLAIGVAVYPFHIKAIPRTALDVKFKRIAVSGR